MKNISKPFENAINFLLYDSLKITLDDYFGDKDKCMAKIINKAYQDATMQGAFNTLIYGNKRENEKKALTDTVVEPFKEKSKELICGFIKELSHSSDTFDYDERHAKLCSDICEWYKHYASNNKVTALDDCYFSFGNAQKWVNMTMKYLYIIESILNEISPSDELVIYHMADKLHIPVDSYIINKIWDLEVKESVPLNKTRLPKTEKQRQDQAHGAFASEKVKSWSQWEQSDYEDFLGKSDKNDSQATLREFLNENPIDWEATAWLDSAKG